MNHFIFFSFCLFTVIIQASLESTEIEKKDVVAIKLITCSPTEKKVMSNFFQNLLLTSEAGYVLYGNKPVYLSNPCNEKNICIGTKWHKEACETREALTIWENLNLGKNQTHYLLHISNPSINPNMAENEFLLINNDAFLKIVRENLPLFQYKMGLKVSPESLLNRLLEKKENISTLFTGKTALLGILLGYGTQNSLLYERGTSIIKPSLAYTTLLPPYKNDLPAVNENDVIKKCDASGATPAFGYTSIKDEIEDLSNSMAYPVSTNAETSAKLAFSCQVNSQESKDLVHMYEEAQCKVETALKSQFFLDEILLKFNTKLIETKKERYSFNEGPIVKILPTLVAKSIWEHFSEIDFAYENDAYLDYFISGMKDAEKTDSMAPPEPDADVIFFDSYQLQLTTRPQIKNNLASSKSFFKTISSQPGIVCIEPFNIYYKVIKQGSGDIVDNKTNKVSMHYLIKDLENKILSGSYTLDPVKSFEISKLMPGLAYAMQGQKKNEVRDVFIHQNFAYGVHSDFGAGKALSVRIELVDMESSSQEIKLPELIPVDLLPLRNSSDSSSLKSLKKKYMIFCGFRTWMHYKKAANFFTLDSILNEINTIQATKKLEPLLNETERTILRRFNLLLYSRQNRSL